MTRLEKIANDLEGRKKKILKLQAKLTKEENAFHKAAQDALGITPGAQVSVADYVNMVVKMLLLGQEDEA